MPDTVEMSGHVLPQILINSSEGNGLSFPNQLLTNEEDTITTSAHFLLYCLASHLSHL